MLPTSNKGELLPLLSHHHRTSSQVHKRDDLSIVSRKSRMLVRRASPLASEVKGRRSKQIKMIMIVVVVELVPTIVLVEWFDAQLNTDSILIYNVIEHNKWTW
ncbi:hypothetical protein PoB_003599000 [Plakobranchus ocellatus]|uniref:Uncharacterized protein n=1 Tax=Plakobranchus ocellatus TaxID=259542 RepID=A0AAV4AQ64_9GAST|nr:hypothetical protein PoB_003599000 [Plakobranchus ocellatus]